MFCGSLVFDRTSVAEPVRSTMPPARLRSETPIRNRNYYYGAYRKRRLRLWWLSRRPNAQGPIKDSSDWSDPKRNPHPAFPFGVIGPHIRRAQLQNPPCFHYNEDAPQSIPPVIESYPSV